MTIENFIEPNIKYLVLSIDFEHSEHADEIRSNTSLDKINGFSCCWRIAKHRTFEKIIIYLKNTKEIYLADFVKKERQEKKWKIYFKNTMLIGSTNLNWKDFVNNGVHLQSAMRYIQIINQVTYPDEIKENSVIYEGAKKQVTVNIYERDVKARKQCIEKYGYKCTICTFDFEKIYGAIGKDFIHVHHLKPLSEIDKEYKVNPIQDLRPVCPNCHAMLHKKIPAYSIEEIKNYIYQNNL